MTGCFERSDLTGFRGQPLLYVPFGGLGETCPVLRLLLILLFEYEVAAAQVFC